MRGGNLTAALLSFFVSVAPQTVPSAPGVSQGKGSLQTVLSSDGAVTVRFAPPEKLASPPWDLELLANHRFSLEKYGAFPYFPVRTIAFEVPSKKVSVQILEMHVRSVPHAFGMAAAGPQPDYRSEVLLSPWTHRVIPILAFPESPFPTQHVIADSPVVSGKKVIARLKLYPFAGDAKGGVVTFADLIVFRIVPQGGASTKESRAIAVKSSPDTKSEAARPLIFTVPTDGIYSIPAEDLFPWWGPDPLPLSSLSLTCQEQDIAYYVSGDGDELLEAGEAILFYGVGGDNLFTPDNAYWLAKDGQGASMASVNRPPPGEESLTHCPREVQFERNVGRYEAHPPGTGDDHWFWERITAPQKADVEIELHNLADSPDFPAELRVALQGATSSHITRIAVNGEPLVEEQWEGLVPKVLQAELPQDLLQEGTNIVTVEQVGEADKPDRVYLDWITVRYDSRFVLEDGQLSVTVPINVPGIIVSGLQGPDVMVFDVTEERTPYSIEGFSTSPANENYRVELGTMSDSERTYILLSGGWANRPSSIRQRSDSTWSSVEEGADWIAIAPSEFLDAARTLASHRESQGLRTAVVDVQDVYDEFNYAIVSPEAIQDFTRFAYENWEPPPRYLLLFGDGHGDYMDWYGTHQPNFILPHYSWIPPLGWMPDDGWFGCVEGDDAFAEVFVGRLPARSLAEGEAIVEKIITYDSVGVPQEWQQQVTFCASAGVTFQAGCQSIAKAAPPNFDRFYLFRDDFPNTASMKEGILDALDAGTSLFFYAGHGNVERWSEDVLHVSDMPSLTNAEKLPIMCMLTCLSGYFAVPWYECLAEELVRTTDGGTVGCIAPTAVAYLSEHVILGQEVLRRICAGATLGQCLGEAKLNSYARGLSESLLRGFGLIGDPATSPRFVSPTPDLLWLY